MSDGKKSTVGPPMYIESQMTTKEIQICRQKYTTYNRTFTLSAFSTDEGFKWLFGCGATLSLEQISNINNNIEYLKKLIKNE